MDKFMDKGMVFLIMTGICVLVLLIGLLKRKAVIVLNFFVRTIIGCVGIIFLNDFLQKQGISVAAGLNAINILTVGSLGIGGFALVYGILFYSLL